MQLKVFAAPSMQAAMEAVKRELGPEALIISVLEAEGEVRLTAAIKREEEFPFFTDTDSFPEAQDAFTKVLAYHKVPVFLREQLERALPSEKGSLAESLIHTLKEGLKFTPLLKEPPKRHLTFVGPPGVGKTVSLAKIAAHLTLEGLKVKVATIDTVKTGAVGQLSLLMKALEKEVRVIESPKHLKEMIEESREEEILLIDTPGCNPFEEEDRKLLAPFLEITAIPPVLVLSAGGEGEEVRELIEAFSNFGADRLICTKLDLVRRLGDLVIASKYLGACAYGASPKIAASLKPLNPETLAGLLLKKCPLEISIKRESN